MRKTGGLTREEIETLKKFSVSVGKYIEDLAKLVSTKKLVLENENSRFLIDLSQSNTLVVSMSNNVKTAIRNALGIQ